MEAEEVRKHLQPLSLPPQLRCQGLGLDPTGKKLSPLEPLLTSALCLSEVLRFQWDAGGTATVHSWCLPRAGLEKSSTNDMYVTVLCPDVAPELVSTLASATEAVAFQNTRLTVTSPSEVI